MANTSLIALVPFVRAMLGERFGAKSDATLIDVMRLVVNMGKVPGFALTPAMDAVTPGLASPREFTLLVVGTALRVVSPDAASFGERTRSLSTQLGDARHVIEDLRHILSTAENGGSSRAMASWQDYGGFCRGFRTMEDFYQKVMRADVVAPWGAFTLTSGGAFVEMGGAAVGGGSSSGTPLVLTPSA